MKICILVVAMALMLVGCSTVKVPSVDEYFPSEETTSVTTSEESSEASSEASSNPSSEPASSAPISSAPPPVSSKAVSSTPPSSKETSSMPPPPPASSAPVSSAPPPPPASSTPVSSKNDVNAPLDLSSVMQSDMQYYEDEILRLVNELRVSKGLSTLTKNAALKSSAFIRSKEMAENNKFSHTRPSGKGFYTAIDEVAYPYNYVSENLAYAEGLTRDSYVESLFKGWCDSDSHYKAMISDKIVEVGISLFEYNGKLYGTQHFGQPL